MWGFLINQCSSCMDVGNEQLRSDSTNDEAVVVLTDETSKNLKVFCALCGKVYCDPYITSCGHTFCKGCVSSGANDTCPFDGTQLSLVIKNLAVAEQVGDVLINCCYGVRKTASHEYEVDPEGCQAIVKLSCRREHEDVCDFAPVECPNSSLCGKMLRRKLKEHSMNCNHARCPHHRYSCSFEGTNAQVQEHIKTCQYEGVKGVLHLMDQRISQLQQKVDTRDKDIERLTSTIADLTSKLSGLETNSNKMESLEDQQAEIKKEMVQAKKSMGLILNELELVQQQLGMAANIEPQHLFKCNGTFVGHKGPVWCLVNTGELLFSASSDNTIKVWNLSASYEGPKTLTGHDGIVLTLHILGNQLFSGSSDNTIKVWNIKALELRDTIMAHDDPVCTLASSNSLLFSGSLRSIKVWDVQTNKLVKLLPSQKHWVRALMASDKYLYSGSYRAVKIWSLEHLEVVHVLPCIGASVYSLAVTDRHIICGTYENLIQVWDVHSLQEVGTLTGHVGTVYGLAVLKAPGQTRLFSGSYDKTIRVWNLELMTCAQTMARHEGSVTCLLVCGGRIYSGAVDSTIKVWR